MSDDVWCAGEGAHVPVVDESVRTAPRDPAVGST